MLLAAGAPRAAEDRAVTFTAVGDFSASPAAQAVLSAMRTPTADFSIALGDLSYGTTGQEQIWCDLVTSRVGAGYPFELIAGNHESDGQNGNINDFSACLPNQLPGVVGTYGRQYYVDVPVGDPLVRYLAISPDLTFPDGLWSYAAGTPRYTWTSEAIDGARAAGIPWVVVGMHKPCLSVGQYSCGEVADVMNLLISKRVDLVLAGHEHHYARTHQLTTHPGCPAVTPDTFAESCVVAGSAQALAKGAGTVFATVGTGGTALRSVDPADAEAGYFAAMSGSTSSPSHGSLEVQVTADTLSGAFVPVTGSFTDSFTISGANLPPVASFTTQTEGLELTAHAGDSLDPDGSITSYEWTFGDGTTASGPVVAHTYASGGEYLVSLTVTDDQGATASTARTIQVAVPGGPQPVVTDSFTRSATNGWGPADLGGTWSTSGSASLFSVQGGRGHIRLASPGAVPGAHQLAISRTDTELRVVVTQDKSPTGNGTTARVQPRRLANGDGYFAAVRFVPNGTINLNLVRLVGTQTKLANVIVPSQTHQPGDSFHVRVQVSGTSPTSIRAKVWEVGTPEPTGWHATGTDPTAALQQPGAVSVRAELGTTATNAPVVMSFDDLWAGPTS